MKNFLNESRALFVKTLEGISSSADKMANNAKFKAKEMAIINRKKELMKSLSDVSYELWLKGVHFPLEIERILDQIAATDDELSQLKAEHFAYLKTKNEGGEAAGSAAVTTSFSNAMPIENSDAKVADTAQMKPEEQGSDEA